MVFLGNGETIVVHVAAQSFEDTAGCGAWIKGMEATAPPASGSADPDIARASQLQHAVEHMNANLHFGRSLPILARSQRVTNHSFPSGGGRLRFRTFGVA